MNAIALLITGAGVVLAIGIAFNSGGGPVTFVLLGLVLAAAALVVAVVRRQKAGGIGPAVCAECGGVISPNAPYCKHCGAPAN